MQEIALAKNNAFAHRDTLENSVKIAHAALHHAIMEELVQLLMAGHSANVLLVILVMFVKKMFAKDLMHQNVILVTVLSKMERQNVNAMTDSNLQIAKILLSLRILPLDLRSLLNPQSQ